MSTPPLGTPPQPLFNPFRRPLITLEGIVEPEAEQPEGRADIVESGAGPPEGGAGTVVPEEGQPGNRAEPAEAEETEQRRRGQILRNQT